ncbi:MAG: triacylglycerol lipase [Eubacteriales bacterium]|nr:triacylglycerol lipase [Eubacteriales bacterium]
MEYWKRAGRVLAVFCLANFLLVFTVVAPLSGWPAAGVLLGLLAFYLYFNLRPRRAKGATRRLRALLGGYELLLVCFFVILAETVFCPALALSGALDGLAYSGAVWMPLLVNALVFVPVVGLLLVNGFFRVLITCKRLRVVWRVLLLLCWWVPLFNLYLFFRVLKAARSEYYFERARLESEAVHAENGDCKTRYPLVLVHGIFFRDWQLIGYWGRIPQALQKCGAEIYYGGQQSAAPVAASAAELKAHILEILERTGAEKVNLIAHSKGGLDSRCAISRLGLADKVASLTTINTPHRGCVFAEHLLQSLPPKLLGQMERKYNAVFHKLGDDKPDFMGGVRDLAADACRAFNEQTPDAEGVLYQSVMSTMKSPKSAGFPLNLTWRLVNKYDKQENDGLVARASAPWGRFLGEVTVPGRRGISHGDIIDLLREDIDGFNVREFYIDLVRDLKQQGL